MTNYSSKTQANKCIFCEIAKRKLTTPGILWEDEKYMAFLSLYPNTLGFSVVIPKIHKSSDILELEDNELSEFIITAKKVSQILKGFFKDVGRIGLIMEGTGIDHAHIKLFPMHETEYLKGGEWRQVSSNNDTFFDKYEGYISSNDSHKASEEELSKLADDIRNYIKQNHEQI